MVVRPAMPVPVSVTCCGLLVALSEASSEAGCGPTAFGENEIPSVHDAPSRKCYRKRAAGPGAAERHIRDRKQSRLRRSANWFCRYLSDRQILGSSLPDGNIGEGKRCGHRHRGGRCRRRRRSSGGRRSCGSSCSKSPSRCSRGRGVGRR